MNNPSEVQVNFPMGISPEEILSWMAAFEADPSYAFHMCPNAVYAELRKYSFVDIEHDVTSAGRKFVSQYRTWKATVSHYPALQEARC